MRRPKRPTLMQIVKSFLLIIMVLVLADGFLPPERQHVTRGMVWGIEVYQRWVSPVIHHGRKMCRFTPTCSEYTRQALLKYGLYKGSAKGTWRIMRCNPWSDGGRDDP